MRTFILDGRIGRDAEIVTTTTGKKCVKFSLANNLFDKKTKQNVPDWFEIISYNDSVINNASHLTKGRYIIVNGRLIPPTAYADKSGRIRVNMQVVGDSIDFPSMNTKSGTEEAQRQAVSTGTTVEAQVAVAAAPATVEAPTPTPKPVVAPAPIADEGDDLPF